MERLKAPQTVIALTASAMLIIGTAAGWFGIENELVREFAEAELAEKYNAAYIIGVIGVVSTALAAHFNKKLLTIIGVIVGLYGAAMVYNQLPDAESREFIQMSVNAGFWLALAGAVTSALTNLFITVKGWRTEEEL